MKNRKRYDKNHKVLNKGEYQRKDGRYNYRWTDSFGKRHAIYAKDLESLRYKEDKLNIQKLEGIKTPPSGLTVEGLYETWITLKRGIRTSTRSGYIQTFDSLIRPAIGKKLVITIKRSDIRAFYIWLIEERGIKVSTVENAHTVLHQVFQYAVDDDILRKNPCERVLREIKLSYNDLKRAKKEALTLKQEINFLKYLHDTERYQRWYPTFFIMANTGMRVGELTGLRWKDIDLEAETINVNHTLVYYDHKDEKGCYFSVHTPKTDNGNRLIVMTQAVKEAFLKEKEYQELTGIISRDVIDGYKGFIFINSSGHVQHQDTLNAAIHRIVNSYNLKILDEDEENTGDLIPHFSCHILRHTFATRMIESGAALKYVQYTMGHSEIQTTMDFYVSVSEEFQRSESKTYENYIQAALDPNSPKREPSNVKITKLA